MGIMVPENCTRYFLPHHSWIFLRWEDSYWAKIKSQKSSKFWAKKCHTMEFPIPAVLSQNVTNKSFLVCVKSEKYASLVTLRPQWDRCRRDEAEMRVLNFKTKWSEFQMPSQTAPAEAKPRCVYSILKPHGQSSRCQVRLLLPRRSQGAYTQF